MGEQSKCSIEMSVNDPKRESLGNIGSFVDFGIFKSSFTSLNILHRENSEDPKNKPPSAPLYLEGNGIGSYLKKGIYRFPLVPLGSPRAKYLGLEKRSYKDQKICKWPNIPQWLPYGVINRHLYGPFWSLTHIFDLGLSPRAPKPSGLVRGYFEQPKWSIVVSANDPIRESLGNIWSFVDFWSFWDLLYILKYFAQGELRGSKKETPISSLIFRGEGNRELSKKGNIPVPLS